jgi:hypothetical protein
MGKKPEESFRESGKPSGEIPQLPGQVNSVSEAQAGRRIGKKKGKTGQKACMHGYTVYIPDVFFLEIAGLTRAKRAEI